MCQAVVWRAHANLPFLSHPFEGQWWGSQPYYPWKSFFCQFSVFDDNCSTYRCIFDVFVNGRWAPCPLPSPQPSWSLLLISFREGQNYIQERAQDLVSNPISALPRASHFTWRPHVSLDPFTWFHSILHILYLYTEASYWVFIVHMHVKLWEVLE